MRVCKIFAMMLFVTGCLTAAASGIEPVNQNLNPAA